MTGTRDQWQPGESAWFEYHCYESARSADAVVWYRSHQQVTVVAEQRCEGQRDGMPTLAERAGAGMPLTYLVRFGDGFTYEVWEDELLTTPEFFYRPDPPPPS